MKPWRKAYVVCVKSGLLPRLSSPPAGFQVGSDPFAWPLSVLWKLPGAGVDNGLNLFFGLFRYRHVAVKILINEQADKHLKDNEVITTVAAVANAVVDDDMLIIANLGSSDK